MANEFERKKRIFVSRKPLHGIMMKSLFIVASLLLISTTIAFANESERNNQIGPPVHTKEVTIVNPTQSDLSGTRWENMKLPSGTKLVISEPEAGKMRTSLIFPAGVVMLEEGINVDNSGHGAVLCSWEIFLDVRAALENCASEEDKKLKKVVDNSIGRINDFIVANSLTSVTKNEVERSAREKIARERKQFAVMSKEGQKKACSSNFLQHFTRYVSDGKFEQEINELLSVPRPPVLNPCL
jgi:hypothetical protein